MLNCSVLLSHMPGTCIGADRHTRGTCVTRYQCCAWYAVILPFVAAGSQSLSHQRATMRTSNLCSCSRSVQVCARRQVRSICRGRALKVVAKVAHPEGSPRVVKGKCFVTKDVRKAPRSLPAKLLHACIVLTGICAAEH